MEGGWGKSLRGAWAAVGREGATAGKRGAAGANRVCEVEGGKRLSGSVGEKERRLGDGTDVVEDNTNQCCPSSTRERTPHS